MYFTDFTRQSDTLVHIDLHDFAEADIRRLLTQLHAKCAAYAVTAATLPSKLPDALRHALMSGVGGTTGGGVGEGGAKWRRRRPLGTVGEFDPKAQRLCVREGERSEVGGQGDEPLQSWAALFEYLEEKGGWIDVLGTGYVS
jgi:hypothetical protein